MWWIDQEFVQRKWWTATFRVDCNSTFRSEGYAARNKTEHDGDGQYQQPLPVPVPLPLKKIRHPNPQSAKKILEGISKSHADSILHIFKNQSSQSHHIAPHFKNQEETTQSLEANSSFSHSSNAILNHLSLSALPQEDSSARFKQYTPQRNLGERAQSGIIKLVWLRFYPTLRFNKVGGDSTPPPLLTPGWDAGMVINLRVKKIFFFIYCSTDGTYTRCLAS